MLKKDTRTKNKYAISITINNTCTTIISIVDRRYGPFKSFPTLEIQKINNKRSKFYLEQKNTKYKKIQTKYEIMKKLRDNLANNCVGNLNTRHSATPICC